MKTEVVSVRLTAQQRQKVTRLARGLDSSVSEIVCRLIDTAEVTPVKIDAFMFTNDNTGAIDRQATRAGAVSTQPIVAA